MKLLIWKSKKKKTLTLNRGSTINYHSTSRGMNEVGVCKKTEKSTRTGPNYPDFKVFDLDSFGEYENQNGLVRLSVLQNQ